MAIEPAPRRVVDAVSLVPNANSRMSRLSVSTRSPTSSVGTVRCGLSRAYSGESCCCLRWMSTVTDSNATPPSTSPSARPSSSTTTRRGAAAVWTPWPQTTTGGSARPTPFADRRDRLMPVRRGIPRLRAAARVRLRPLGLAPRPLRGVRTRRLHVQLGGAAPHACAPVESRHARAARPSARLAPRAVAELASCSRSPRGRTWTPLVTEQAAPTSAPPDRDSSRGVPRRTDNTRPALCQPVPRPRRSPRRCTTTFRLLGVGMRHALGASMRGRIGAILAALFLAGCGGQSVVIGGGDDAGAGATRFPTGTYTSCAEGLHDNILNVGGVRGRGDARRRAGRKRADRDLRRPERRDEHAGVHGDFQHVGHARRHRRGRRRLLGPVRARARRRRKLSGGAGRHRGRADGRRGHAVPDADGNGARRRGVVRTAVGASDVLGRRRGWTRGRARRRYRDATAGNHAAGRVRLQLPGRDPYESDGTSSSSPEAARAARSRSRRTAPRSRQATRATPASRERCASTPRRRRRPSPPRPRTRP